MALELNGTTGVSAVQAGAVESGDLPAGSVIQVVTANYTGVTSESISPTSFGTVNTDLTVSITPKSSTSKLFLLLNLSASSNDNNGNTAIVLTRDGSEITETKNGTTTSRVSLTAGSSSDQGVHNSPVFSSFLVDANSTSATTFSFKFYNRAGATRTLYVNRNLDDTDHAFSYRCASSFTIMEIAG